MRKILLYLVHPHLDHSRIHKSIAPIARTHPAVNFVDLYAEYPDFYIETAKEQKRLLAHDVILFQHPIYWYSCPALMKEWIDVVLELDFAYGENGSKLEGKAFGQIVSAGSLEQDYTRRGEKGNRLTDFLVGFETTATDCGMYALPPLAIYDTDHANQDNHLENFKASYKTYLDALANEETKFSDIGKRDDLISTFRKIVGV